jgi:uncharacterized membrane protein YdfJ with MMPL/SSD domain
VPDVAPTVATMIGLGVGIDYSLFIVTRARSARHDGMSVHDAIGHAARPPAARSRSPAAPWSSRCSRSPSPACR